MGSQKFIETLLINAIPNAGAITEPCCLRVLEGLRSNALLALMPTTLPGFATWMAMEWIMASNNAKRDLLGNRDPATYTQRQKNAIGNLMESYMLGSLLRCSADEQKDMMGEKTIMFEKFSMWAGTNGELALQNSLKSIIIQSWTAVEVLVEDLIAECIKDYPNTFTHFNLSDHKFRTRDQFRTAYKKAFTHDYVSIRSHTKSGYFNALALLRNVIVHKGSKADVEFLGPAKKIDALSQFHAHDVGHAVEPHGETVRMVVDGAFLSAFNLIESVSAWLNIHKKP